jgi:hypothetical protein
MFVKVIEPLKLHVSVERLPPTRAAAPERGEAECSKLEPWARRPSHGFLGCLILGGGGK